MANKKNWIKSAIHPEKKGSLRRSLKVKAGEKIPLSKLKKAEESKNPKTAKRARLAETLRKINKK